MSVTDETMVNPLRIPATTGARARAVIIDAVLISILAVALMGVSILVMDRPNLALLGAILAVILLLREADLTLTGYSVGGRIAGVRWVDARTDNRPGIGMFFHADLVLITIVPTLGFGSLLLLSSASKDKNLRGWHDRISGLIAVSTKDPLADELEDFDETSLLSRGTLEEVPEELYRADAEDLEQVGVSETPVSRSVYESSRSAQVSSAEQAKVESEAPVFASVAAASGTVLESLTTAPRPEPVAEVAPELELAPAAQAKPTPETTPEAEAATEILPVTEPETAAELKPGLESVSAPAFEPVAAVAPEVEAKPEVDPEPMTQAAPEAEADDATEVLPVTAPKPVAAPEPVGESAAVSEPAPVVEAAAELAPEPVEEPKAALEPAAEPQDAVETAPVPEPENVSSPEPQHKTAAKVKSAPEAPATSPKKPVAERAEHTADEPESAPSPETPAIDADAAQEAAEEDSSSPKPELASVPRRADAEAEFEQVAQSILATAEPTEPTEAEAEAAEAASEQSDAASQAQAVVPPVSKGSAKLNEFKPFNTVSDAAAENGFVAVSAQEELDADESSSFGVVPPVKELIGAPRSAPSPSEHDDHYELVQEVFARRAAARAAKAAASASSGPSIATFDAEDPVSPEPQPKESTSPASASEVVDDTLIDANLVDGQTTDEPMIEVPEGESLDSYFAEALLNDDDAISEESTSTDSTEDGFPAGTEGPAPAFVDDRSEPVMRLMPFTNASKAIHISGPTIIGRAPLNTSRYPEAKLVALGDSAPSVSKTHAAMMPTEHGILVTDLGSSNGTRVVRAGKARRIPTDVAVMVHEGGVVLLGQTAYRVQR
ncbi:RDD family protein [Actinomyces bovis]|uniref:RDD family protein n=1 Tax=Actinomyces bovis TaxID=1658 RepID=UPI0014742253|nr:RDD family protein [Actinomyces bovis]